MMMAAALLLAIGTAAAGEYTEIFDQSYTMDSDGRVGLENINGDVTIEVWDQNEVRVYAVKSASSPERLAALRIEVDATADRVFVDTRYPNSRDLSSEDRHGHSKVEYSLTVPRFALLDGIELVNGDLLVDGVEGGIGSQTVNGNVVVRGGDGEMEIETVNGRIELDFASTMTEEVELSSVNGTIEVVLNGSAEIRVETVNGSIRNDYGIEVKKGKYVGASMEGTVGGGGPMLDIETVNGSVTIR
jgi:DUF4097 and DUF4098 domain-containing protein YvlB